jgi:D-alanyl-D-alanine carboxypeptidase (penicillin-binding protein 5/6)
MRVRGIQFQGAAADGSDSTVANAALPINVLRFNLTVIPIRRIFIVFAALLMLASSARFAAAAQSYVIVDSQTGYVLQEQEARHKCQIGSLTKIATAVVVLDWAEHKSGNLNQVVVIPPEAFTGTGENNIGFQPGDTIALRDLLYAALVQSDNIAAYTLAYHVGSTLESLVPASSDSKITPVIAFVSQMNALAKQLKMERTRFVNPHGIDENVKPRPFSTAEDMARLARYAMNKAGFRFYVSQKERQISFQRDKRTLSYLLRNTNELLGTHGIDGVKTGRTARAGECLILSANRESEVVNQGQYTSVFPRHIIAVLLGSTNRFGEGAGLIEHGWQLYDQWASAGRLVDPNKVL